MMLLSSCSSMSSLDSEKQNLRVEYFICSDDSNINKIIYSTTEESEIIINNISKRWSKDIIIKEKKIIKLEVFGVYKNSNVCNIKLSIKRHTSRNNYIIREKTFFRKKNKYFHYYLISEI